MKNKDKYDWIDEGIVRLVKAKADQLIGRYGLTESDRDDVEQELFLDLLTRLPRSDIENPSRKGLLHCVVNHKVARIIEERTAARRHYARCNPLAYIADLDCDLQSNETGSKGIEFGIIVRNPSEPSPESYDLKLDIQEVIRQLPARSRQLCEMLMTYSVTQIIHRTGWSRSGIYYSIQTIRKVFESAGFKDYLNYSSDTSERIPVIY